MTPISIYERMTVSLLSQIILYAIIRTIETPAVLNTVQWGYLKMNDIAEEDDYGHLMKLPPARIAVVDRKSGLFICEWQLATTLKRASVGWGGIEIGNFGVDCKCAKNALCGQWYEIICRRE